MQLQFLGTAGSQPIPLPTCDCGLCREAREEGAPYARRGYSMHLPELDAVIDASEFLPANLSRWRVPTVEYCFLTHWHPDHAGGLRALSMRDPPKRDGETFREAKRRTAPTLVTTRRVYERACETVGIVEYLVEDLGSVELHALDERPLSVGGVSVEAIPYELTAGGPRDATGFLFRDGDTTLAVVADDAREFPESRLPADTDAAVFECGGFTHGPGGERLVTEGVLPEDLTHEEVRERIERVDPDRALLSHIGHQYARSYDDFRRLEADSDRIEFAYDGLTVEI